MKKYAADIEEKIHAEGLVRDWSRSGIVEKIQSDAMLSDLATDLQRTNTFLRLLLFGFAVFILAAGVLLIGSTLALKEESAVGLLCLLFAGGCLLFAELSIEKFKLYRFGIEEAGALAAAVLVCIAAGLFTTEMDIQGRGELPLFVALLAGILAGLGLFIRFGYVYAAIGAMICLGAAPFQIRLPEVESRIVSAVLLLTASAIAGRRRHEGVGAAADDYGFIEAFTWMEAYAFLNLQLSFWRTYETGNPVFYYSTYAAVWILPSIGLFLGLRDRNRFMIDINLFLVLVTLTTNKLYLGLARQTWDPILLGALLIGTAVALRRWLAGAPAGFRYGFTASRLLNSEKRTMAAATIASMALQPGAASPPPETPKPEMGGGSSGGAGASGNF